MRSIVIYCYDPRAAAIPTELAKLWPDETYPGDLIFDEFGNRVGSTATILPIVVAGGRAVDAVRSITIGHHLFGLQNVIVTPHIGWRRLESRQRLITLTAENIAAFIANKPSNVVN